MSWPTSSAVFGPLFTTETMAEIFSDRALVQAMLDVEAALAKAEAECGIVPPDAAEAIAAAANADFFDIDALGREIVNGGNLAIPLVKRLTALVAERDGQASRWVHWGSTSQDIIDTGLVLQMRAGLAYLEGQLTALCESLAALTEAHAATPMIARTLMQQATPATFGLKAAGWLSAIARSFSSFDDIKPHVLSLQYGGASGNLAAMHPHGLKIAEAMGRELALSVPELPWHSNRGRIAEMGAALGILLGSLGKMARDIALMAQTEIGEFREPSGGGRGGSSAMPHKANPVGCARILAAARRAPGLVSTLLAAMDQEHERGLGGWHAEWDVLPELFRLAAGALDASLTIIAEGTADTGRMRANLNLTNGLVMAEAISVALAGKIGKAEAHRLMQEASRQAVAESRHLRDCLAGRPEIAAHFDAPSLERLFNPEQHLGAAEELTKAAVASYRRWASRRGG